MVSTFQIDSSRTFVSGLFWHPLSSSGTNYRKESAELAKELNFDLAVWLTTPVSQVGFASRNDSVNPGWVSAAAAISRGLQVEYDARDFLCAVEVGGGDWLYVAQRDGVILPDGDIIGSTDEIKARLLQDLSLGSWPLVYAPKAWGIHGALEERSFEDFLPQKGGRIDYKNLPAVKPISQWSVNAGSFGSTLKWAAVLLVLPLTSYYFYNDWKTTQEMQLAAQTPPLLPHPWKSMPRAIKHLEACAEALPNLGTLWPGNWEPKDITCANGSFTAVWSRNEYGWIEHLRKVQPKVVIIGDGSIATLSTPVKMPAGEDEIAPTEGARNVAIYNAAQKYNFKVTLTPVPPPPPPPPPKEGEPPQPVPDWREINWSVQSTELPAHIVVESLDGPGFRIKQMKKVFANGKSTWTLEGTQYVQL